MAVDRLSSVPRRLLGLVMIGIVVALLALCVLVYNKVFTPSVPVTVQIDQADNSFLPKAEVRMHGVAVGEVSKAVSDGKVATLTLALEPDKVARIPRNVTVALLPKSLFGERFVSLQSPTDPSKQTIQAGDIISRDHSSNTIQIEQVFDHLLPLIQAVRPADLASTLGALNQALSGRGEELGQTITRLHQYLVKFNPVLPELTQDIQALPKFSDTYAKAAPDLIEGLKTLTTTTKTIDEKQDEFANLYSSVTDSSDDLREFLDDNRSNLVNLLSTARPTLELLARYSPEFPCLFNRLADAVPQGDIAFGKGLPRPALHVTAEIIATRGKFLPHQDEPEFTDNRGPACYPNTPDLPQYPGGPYLDGSTHPPASTQASQLGPLLSGRPVTPKPLGIPFLGAIGSEEGR